MRESGRKSTEDIRVLSFAAMETKGADSSASGDEFMPPGAWAAISSQGCSCGASGSSCCGAGGNGDPMALYRQVRSRYRCQIYHAFILSLELFIRLFSFTAFRIRKSSYLLFISRDPSPFFSDQW